MARLARLGFWLMLGVIAAPDAARAGAWTLEQGRGQVVVTDTTSRADKVFDSGGNLQPTPRYNKTELQALIEYGLADWVTAIVSPGFQHIDIGAPVAAQRTGAGYSEFGARVRLLQGGDPAATSWVVSGQATTRVPGTYDTANPAAIGYTGTEVDVRGLFGAAFRIMGKPAFFDAQVAQRFRSGGPPDEFRVDLTFGVRPFPQWLLLVQALNVISEGDGPPLFPSYRYHKLQASMVYDITAAWSVQVGGFTTFAGRNALQENGLILGAWYRF